MEQNSKTRAKLGRRGNTQNLESHRLQKLLSMSALGSRREIEEWIRQGRVRLNSKVANLGDKATNLDRISLDGKRVRLRNQGKTKVVMLNKPTGYLCSKKSDEGKPTVYNLLKLPKKERWVMVGRLDFNTSGLLLFTNNGDLAQKLMHPSNEIIRSYAVRVFPKATSEQLKKIEKGVMLEDGFAQFESLREVSNQNMSEAQNCWYQVSLKQGRYREIRRMWHAVGLTVSRLIRTQFGPFELPRSLARGKYRFVEAEVLKNSLNILSKSDN